MTTEDAVTSSDVVTSNILVHYIPVLCLFDFGASHCFISDSFVEDHNVACVGLDSQ